MRKLVKDHPVRAFLYAFVFISEIFLGLRMYEVLDKTSDAIQAWAVTVLAGITAVYAWQTKAQADASVKMASAALYTIRQPHFASLVALGKRLLEESLFPEPNDLIELQWRLDFQISYLNSQTDPLYARLKSHLQGNKCWRHLETLHQQFEVYQERCSEKAEEIAKQASDRFKELPNAIRLEHVYAVFDPLVLWPMCYPPQQSTVNSWTYRLNFDYKLYPFQGQTLEGATEERWALRFGMWTFEADSKDDLERLQELHEALCTDIKKAAQDGLSDLWKLWREAEEPAQALARELQPDGRLHRLIAEGHCDSCL